MACDKELNNLYGHAFAYATASLYEGFGLTILEAMRARLPVASSDRASLPYVGGKACVYFDPDDELDVARVLRALIRDKQLRRQLVELGEERVREYTWDTVAQRISIALQNI